MVTRISVNRNSVNFNLKNFSISKGKISLKTHLQPYISTLIVLLKLQFSISKNI